MSDPPERQFQCVGVSGVWAIGSSDGTHRHDTNGNVHPAARGVSSIRPAVLETDLDNVLAAVRDEN